MENKEIEKPQKKEIALRRDGKADLKSMDDLYRVSASWLKSGMLPHWYKDPLQVITALEYARELGLNGITALRQIAIVKGNPCLFGDLPLTLAMNSGKIKKKVEYTFDKDLKKICLDNKNIKAEVFGAYCYIQTAVEEKESVFTIDDAKRAKLLPASESSAWFKYPQYMLKYRARTPALKDTVPEALNGVAVLEYDFNMSPQTIDIGSNRDEDQLEKAKELFGGEE